MSGPFSGRAVRLFYSGRERGGLANQGAGSAIPQNTSQALLSPASSCC